MTDISPASLKILKKLRKLEYVPEDQIPPEFDRYRLQYLVDTGLLETFTLVPPGREDYERGLVAYKLSPKGEDAIYKYHKVEREARIALILSIIALLISLHSTFSPQRKNEAATETARASADIITGKYGYL